VLTAATLGVQNTASGNNVVNFYNSTGSSLLTLSNAGLLTTTNASTTNATASASFFAQGNRVSGERYISGKISTSTAWTASSSVTSVYGDAYRFYFPFTGTISSFYMGTDTGTLEVKVTCGSNTFYVAASSTANLNTTSLSCAKGDLTTVIAGAPASTPTLAAFTLIGTGY